MIRVMKIERATKMVNVSAYVMRLILPTIAIGLSTLATPALAQEPGQQPTCAPYAEVEAKLAAEYHETRVQQGVVGEGRAMLVILASPDGATWTALMVRHDGLACMAAAGSDWQVRHDDAPSVPEQGS
jgi:hypothetical protein